MAEDADVEQLVLSLNNWLTYWRHTVMRVALPAVDLANHDDSFLSTHIVFIELLYHKDVTDPVRRFTMNGGEVFSRTAFKDILRTVYGSTEEEVAEFDSDNRGDNVIQVCIMAEDHLRCIFIDTHDVAKARAASKEVSGELSKYWATMLMKRIADGEYLTEENELSMLRGSRV
ncbi:hypothetical protein NM688_g6389 [Phlebia brevispora]|uniref:Uncharacterized protein n=1 Tax=Phlebia brevispora TaxID=194682 RepID=A0ACC1SGM0_9APHY|nr:hypothetical protein NM688_g6389 [Phlebia brevispora]